MFVNTTIASRIERAEAGLTQAVTGAAVASGRAPRAFVRELGGGVAAYVRPGSPMNKLIGLGLVEPLDWSSQLDGVEQALGAENEPARVELSTLAAPELGALLTARGYRLIGFENVLVRPLSLPTVDRQLPIRSQQVTRETQATWQRLTAQAVATADDSGVPVDQFTRQVVNDAIADMLEVNAFGRWLAFLDGSVAGAASMLVRDGVALLSGSATLPAHRRRGVQAALIATRLEHARKQGAEIAVVTTAPGSQSQSNVMKHGFTLGYSRAILVRAAV